MNLHPRRLMESLKLQLLDFLSAFPEAEEFVSKNTLNYWLRRERQDLLDGKGRVSE